MVSKSWLGNAANESPFVSVIRSVPAISSARATMSTLTDANWRPARSPRTGSRHPGRPASSVASGWGVPTTNRNPSCSRSASSALMTSRRSGSPSPGSRFGSRVTRSRSRVVRAASRHRSSRAIPPLSTQNPGASSSRRTRILSNTSRRRRRSREVPRSRALFASRCSSAWRKAAGVPYRVNARPAGGLARWPEPPAPRTRLLEREVGARLSPRDQRPRR